MMKRKHAKSPLFLLAMTTLIASAAMPGAAFAATTAPNLGSASSFGLLATSITNANPTSVTGNVGSGIAGQTVAPSTVVGTDYLMGPVYNAAYAALSSAIATHRPSPQPLQKRPQTSAAMCWHQASIISLATQA